MEQQQTNIERAAEVIYAWMSSWDDETQALQAAKALADDNLITPDPAEASAVTIGGQKFHPFPIWHSNDRTTTLTRNRDSTIHIDNNTTGKRVTISQEQAKVLIPMILAAINYAEQDTP